MGVQNHEIMNGVNQLASDFKSFSAQDVQLLTNLAAQVKELKDANTAQAFLINELKSNQEQLKSSFEMQMNELKSLVTELKDALKSSSEPSSTNSSTRSNQTQSEHAKENGNKHSNRPKQPQVGLQDVKDEETAKVKSLLLMASNANKLYPGGLSTPDRKVCVAQIPFAKEAEQMFDNLNEEEMNKLKNIDKIVVSLGTNDAVSYTHLTLPTKA